MSRHASSGILRRLDLNLLVVFDAVLRLGSITRAADHLDMTQSAVSHAINRLRDFFGDPLFVRSGKGVAPTSRAQDLGGTISSIIELIRGPLLTQAAFDPSMSERTITLFFHDYGELVILPAFARRVRSAAPHLRIKVAQVRGEDLERGLEDGSVDLAISGPAAFSGEILQQRLFVAKLAVVASKDARFAEPLTIEDYAAIDQIVVRPSRPDRLPIDSPLIDWGLARREAIVTPYTMAVPSLLVANPDMIATVPAELADVAVGAGLIRRLATTFQFPDVPILQFWHRRYHSEHFNVWLRSMMRETLAGRTATPPQ